VGKMIEQQERNELYPMKTYNHGRLSIPQKLCKKYNIKDGDTVIFVDKGNKIEIYLKEEYLKGVHLK